MCCKKCFDLFLTSRLLSQESVCSKVSVSRLNNFVMLSVIPENGDFSTDLFFPDIVVIVPPAKITEAMNENTRT